MTLTAAVVYTAIALVFIAGLAVTAGIIWLACLAAYLLIMLGITAALVWAARGQKRHDAQALAMVCDPCHGQPGRCLCLEKCEHPLCGADDTGIRELRAELDAMLGEGEQ